MIKLNITNGDVSNRKIKITSNLSLGEISSIGNIYEIRLSVENGDYISYVIPYFDDKEAALSLSFYKEKLTYLNISLGENYAFPAYEITEKKKATVRSRLASIGGENDYIWGSVSYSEDIKGGNVSIRIKYNQG